MSLIKIISLFGPKPSAVSINEKLISALAGLLSIALIMLVSKQFLAPEALPWVVASMGASAVLLFAVPNGPLSQPWSFVVGHLLSAFIGISVAKLVNDPLIASSLAVSLAIFAMYLTSSLHPPGGATALTAVVGGSAITDLGYWYMLTPIAVNLLVMLVWALIINNILKQRDYPNGINKIIDSPAKTTIKNSIETEQQNSIRRSDLHSALTEMDIFIDVAEDDLNTLFNLTLMHTVKKNIGDILCHEIMSSSVITIDYDTDVEQVWELMINKRVHAFPVVDKANHVLGIVSLHDFLNQINFKDNSKSGSNVIFQLNNFIKKTTTLHTHKAEYAGHLMSKPVITINKDQHVLELFELFYRHNIHHIPVVDKHKKLVGIITPKDLLLAFQTLIQ